MYSSVDIAQKIKELAQTQNIVLKKMFKDLGLNENTPTNLRQGKRINCDSLARIADYLDCSVDFLLGRTAHVKYFDNSSAINPNEKELLNIYRNLSSSDQQSVLNYIRFIIYQSSEENKLIPNITGQQIPIDTLDSAARNGSSNQATMLNNEELESIPNILSEQGQ